jgi:hypothetical protein
MLSMCCTSPKAEVIGMPSRNLDKYENINLLPQLWFLQLRLVATYLSGHFCAIAHIGTSISSTADNLTLQGSL